MEIIKGQSSQVIDAVKTKWKLCMSQSTSTYFNYHKFKHPTAYYLLQLRFKELGAKPEV